MENGCILNLIETFSANTLGWTDLEQLVNQILHLFRSGCFRPASACFCFPCNLLELPVGYDHSDRKWWFTEYQFIQKHTKSPQIYEPSIRSTSSTISGAKSKSWYQQLRSADDLILTLLLSQSKIAQFDVTVLEHQHIFRFEVLYR